MPEYVAGDGGVHGHMVLGHGSKGYLVTLILPGDNHDIMLVEVWSDGMISAIAMIEEMSVGEVACCLKLWA